MNVTPIEEPFKNWVEIKKYLSKHEALPEEYNYYSEDDSDI